MIGGVLNLDQLFKAINETLYMTAVSLVLATVLGLLIGILLYCTQTGGLFQNKICLLYTSPSPRDRSLSRMPSSA